MAYCDRAGVEAVFGTINVQVWGNLDNGDITDGDVLIAITARITRAISDAQAEIDARLRGGPYTIPFVEPVEKMIQMICEKLTGVILYESRGVQDYQAIDPAIQGAQVTKPAHRLAWHRKWAERMMDMLLSGGIQLDLTQIGDEFPEVLPINPYPQELERA